MTGKGDGMVKRGKKTETTRKFYPGYLVISAKGTTTETNQPIP